MTDECDSEKAARRIAPGDGDSTDLRRLAVGFLDLWQANLMAWALDPDLGALFEKLTSQQPLGDGAVNASRLPLPPESHDQAAQKRLE